MSARLKPQLTPDEYLAIERQAEYKSEYYRDGSSVGYSASTFDQL